MKKSLIALAVAGAMTAPLVAQADATVYGDIEYNINSVDDADLDMGLGHARLGVKGTVDNDIDGLTTGYKLEFQLPTGDNLTDTSGLGSTTSGDVATRQANIYMGGDFGTVTFGHQNNPAETADRGYSQDADTLHGITDRYQGVTYSTPDMSGFSAEIGVGASSDYGDDDVDVTTLGLSYSGAGLDIGLGYFSVEDDAAGAAETDVTSLGISYGFDAFSVSFQYQDTDVDGGTDEEAYLIGGEYSYGAGSVYLDYVDLESDAGDDDMVVVGTKYSLGKKAYVGVEYYAFDEEVSNQDYLSLFYRVKF